MSGRSCCGPAGWLAGWLRRKTGTEKPKKTSLSGGGGGQTGSGECGPATEANPQDKQTKRPSPTPRGSFFRTGLVWPSFCAGHTQFCVRVGVGGGGGESGAHARALCVGVVGGGGFDRQNTSNTSIATTDSGSDNQNNNQNQNNQKPKKRKKTTHTNKTNDAARFASLTLRFGGGSDLQIGSTHTPPKLDRLDSRDRAPLPGRLRPPRCLAGWLPGCTHTAVDRWARPNTHQRQTHARVCSRRTTPLSECGGRRSPPPPCFRLQARESNRCSPPPRPGPFATHGCDRPPWHEPPRPYGKWAGWGGLAVAWRAGRVAFSRAALICCCSPSWRRARETAGPSSFPSTII